MQDPMMSTPKYQKVGELQSRSGSTLFLLQHTQHEQAERILQQLRAEDQANLFILAEMPDANANTELFQQQITQRIKQATSGWHAVVFGDEAFMWSMAQGLQASGFLQDEIHLVSSLGPRKVYCVHCSQQQLIDSQAEYCRCGQCGVHLLVRSHFSRRLGAYMGVCADADFPHGDAA